MLGHNGAILRHNTKWLGEVITPPSPPTPLPNNSFFSLRITPQFVSTPDSMYIKITPGLSDGFKPYPAGWEGEQADGTTVIYRHPYWVEEDKVNAYPELYYYNTVPSTDYNDLATSGLTLNAREDYYVKEFNIAYWNGFNGQYKLPRTITVEVQLFGCDTSVHSSNPFITFYAFVNGNRIDDNISIEHVVNPSKVTYSVSRY